MRWGPLDAKLTAGKFSVSPPRRTISDAVIEFLTYKDAEGISRKTKAKYGCELAEFQKFTESSGVDRVEQVDEELFLAYRQHRRKAHLVCDGRSLHEKTLYVGLMIVKGFMRWCGRKRYVEHNPLADVRVGKPAFRPAYCPDLITVKQIIAATAGSSAVVLVTLALTGMRSGELQLLKRKDVDLTGNWILIQTLKAKMTRIRPVRKVPIHPDLRPVIESYLATTSGSPNDPLFRSDSAGTHVASEQLLSTRALNDDVQRIAAGLGIITGRVKEGFVIHSLRHFFRNPRAQFRNPSTDDRRLAWPCR